MTVTFEKGRKNKTGAGLFGILFVCFLLAVIIYSEKSREAMLEAMIMCAKILIPSVFPFAVIGNLIGSGAAEFPRFLTEPVAKIFGVSIEGAKALLPGLVAGFPVGASAAVRLYERGKIDKYDFEKICAFSCTPGAAFVISGVGEGMFNDKKTGVIIYLSVIISVFAVGCFYRIFRKSKVENTVKISLENGENIKFTEIISSSVKGSGNAMIVMSAFVLFFSQLTFFATELTAYLNAPVIVDSVFKALLEVSQACRGASIMSKTSGSLVAVFATAWSGLSFQMQTLALCGKYADGGTARKLALLRLCIALLSLIIYTALCRVSEIT